MPAHVSVLFFTNSVERGGAEEHILTLLHGLDRARFHPALACPEGLAARLRADAPPDVEITSLTLRRPQDVAAAGRLARLVRLRRVDVLHSHLFYSSLYASPVGRLAGVPAIIETPHIAERWRSGWKGSFAVDRLIGRSVDYYVAVSHANARYLVQDKRLPARKVVVIPNGCDLARFDRPRDPASPLKAGLGLGPEDQVLLAVGRLAPQKGHEILLEALPAVRREVPRLHTVVVGEGSLREPLERRTRELGLDDRVHFVGYRPDVAGWYAAADLSVLPSHFEGLPLVTVESLAAGCPVVATAVDGTPEVVVDGVTGLTVPPGDPDRLGQAILRLVQDPVLRRTLGQQGRAHVRAHFDREQQVRLTEALYLRALGLPGPAVRSAPVSRDSRDRAAWQPVRSGAGPC
jgi:glycosyltransferase involved in cell wall biosynthesis